MTATLARTLPFKAAGGKAWLVRDRLSFVWKNNTNGTRRLFDPFVGGGAFPLLLQPERCFLSDANPYLINAYLWLQAGAPRQIDYIHSEAFYYQLRDRFNELRGGGDVMWLGEAFFLLNRSCHKGLWRVNKCRGDFNVPWGDYKRLAEIDLAFYASLLKQWQISHSGYISAINEHLQDDDFLFLDPPYDATFNSYTQFPFEWEDQKLVAAIASQHPGPVIVCNSASNRIIDLYHSAGLTVEIIAGGQAIQNGKKAIAPKPKEVFAYRNLP